MLPPCISEHTICIQHDSVACMKGTVGLSICLFLLLSSYLKYFCIDTLSWKISPIDNLRIYNIPSLCFCSYMKGGWVVLMNYLCFLSANLCRVPRLCVCFACILWARRCPLAPLRTHSVCFCRCLQRRVELSLWSIMFFIAYLLLSWTCLAAVNFTP